MAVAAVRGDLTFNGLWQAVDDLLRVFRIRFESDYVDLLNRSPRKLTKLLRELAEKAE